MTGAASQSTTIAPSSKASELPKKKYIHLGGKWQTQVYSKAPGALKRVWHGLFEDEIVALEWVSKQKNPEQYTVELSAS